MGQSMKAAAFARVATIISLSAGLGACLGAGLKNYKEGNKLRAAGKYQRAEAEYKKALDADPNSAKYQTALKELKGEVKAEVKALKREARSLEKQGEWDDASRVYAKAHRLDPKNDDIAARAALSELKGEGHGPGGWYRGVAKINDDLPGNKLVQRTLRGARARAFQYHLRIANDLFDAGQGQKAWQEYAAAREIDPAMPGLDQERFSQAEAMNLAERGDLRLATGDIVGAYELYRASLDKHDNPSVASKMRRAKSKAGRILSRLESARSKAKAGRWWQAVAEYDKLSQMDGVPSSVDTEAAEARENVVNLACDDARKHAKAGNYRRAQGSILAAIKFSTLRETAADNLKAGLSEVSRGDPGKGRKLIETSGAPKDDPIYIASMDVAREGALNILAKARRARPRAAMTLLGKLGAFAKDMPEVKKLRRTLLKSNFTAMLDEALALAKRGDDSGAAEVLGDALRASKAPARLRDAAEEGCAFLASKQYGDAEDAFARAQAAAPRSKLAQRGLDISRLFRKGAEKTALSIVRNGGDDDVAIARAVEVLAAARKANPRHADARKANEIILKRAKKGSDLDDLKIASLLGLAGKLADAGAKAEKAIEDGNSSLANGDYAAAQEHFEVAARAAPSSGVAALGRQISKDRLMASLRSGATQVASGGGEGAARALAKLLIAKPNDADAKAALQGLADRARKAAADGEDAEAAQFIRFVIIATSPEPGLEETLNKGADAVAEGDMAGAEVAFSDADDMESEHVAATLGLEIAKSARLAGMQKLLASAKEGQNLEAMKAELKRAIELDAASPEARMAYAELLKAAVSFGDKGEDRLAASLLDTANVVSKPANARESIAEANALLADGKHEEAQAAYEKISQNAKSKLVSTGRSIASGRIHSVFMAGVAKLESGEDLDAGATATAELLKLDSKNERARSAIDKTIERAEKEANGGDQAAVVANLRAASVASAAGPSMIEAIELLDSGKAGEAEEAFGALDGDLAKRAMVIARMRKIAALKAAVGGDDADAAKSIRALLEADPNDAEARKGLERILAKAKSKGRAKDHEGAAAALSAALIASGLSEDLTSTIDVGVTHLREGRFAEAEQSFGTALELASDTKVAKVGQAVAKDRRVASQREALAKIGAEDPVPHARVLKASLLVDPTSGSVKKAYRSLLSRAKRAAKKGNDAELARVLDAAVLVENVPNDVAGAVTAADVKVAEKAFSDAESMFRAVNEDEKVSDVAALAEQLVRSRRIEMLKSELVEAEKAKEVLLASDVVGKILELDPKNRTAQRAAKKYGKLVVAKRLEAAKAERDLGKLGAAHLYLRRVLKLQPGNGKAKTEIATVEGELKKRLDLVTIVDKVGRAPGAGCAGIEAPMRKHLMKKGSNSQELGMYVLDPDWTEAVEDGAEDAPRVSGTLVVTADKCASTAGTADGTFKWAVRVPDAKGVVVTEGEIVLELPASALPRDEQDEAGNNARAALAGLVAGEVVERLVLQRAEIDQWLLALAEHGVSTKDVAAAADAYARLLVKKPSRIDGKRAEAVERALGEVYK